MGIGIPSQFDRSGLIDRPRLLHKLSDAGQYRLTLVSAPPGYGKTTLAAQFARHAPYPIVWHTVEESERDVPILYAHCLNVLEPILPDVRELPPAHGIPPGDLAALITAHIKTHLDQPIFYLMDDVHHLAGSPQAEMWLRTFVATAPPNCHLILLSRILPDVPLTEMISRSEVLAIGQEELRLTRQEIDTLSRQTYTDGLSSEKIHEIEAHLEGWPAGTVLALRPLPADLERAMLRGGRGPEALFDSLASSMLSTLPPDLRDFLLASSTLTRLTPQLCSTCLQWPHGGFWLTQVLQRNLFLTKATGGLVYHALFRNFLQRQLRQINPELYVSLHTRAAHWFEDQNQIIEAFDHYVEAGLIDCAAELAERTAQTYFTQGKVETLLNWRARLEGADVYIPRLLCACAKISIERYDYEATEKALQQAETGLTAQLDPDGYAEVQIIRAMLYLQKGEYAGAVELAKPLVDHPHFGGRALTTMGVASLFLGQLERAAHYLEQALPVYRADGDAYALSQMLQNLQVVYNRLGNIEQASACLQEVVALRRELGSGGALALALNNLGCHYYQHSDYEQALNTLREGLSVVARVSNRRAESYLLWSLGDIERDRGNFDEALQLYNKALELHSTNEPSLRCSVLMSMSVLRRWQSRYEQAAALAREAADLADRNGLLLESPVAQMHLWAARAYLGRADEALLHLETIVNNLRVKGQQMELAQALILCAVAALGNDDETTAQMHLKAALEAARNLSSMQPLAAEVFHTPALHDLSPDMPGYAIFMRDFNKLRDAHYTSVQISAGSGANLIPQDTYSLRVCTLGTESIERDGTKIPSSAWRAAKAREIFLYLLFNGAQNREQICLEIWPDSSMQKARQNFHTTMHRARQAVGLNVINFDEEIYQINPEVDVWCDARELDDLARQANHLSRRDPRTEDLLRRAVSLYKGDFLMSVDADWASALREKLRATYLDALIGLGECARARSDYRAAINAFKRALDIDPYREDIMRAVMMCYGELGEKSQALSHFHKLRALLWEDLATEPSPETLALARSLLT